MMSAIQSAPDATVAMWDGSHTRLSRLWASSQLVLVFLRHLG
ncbi:MAG: hypothetical protein P8X96_08330 [Desulfobacteraceae bacterium]|jgi:hypothetical protein